MICDLTRDFIVTDDCEPPPGPPTYKETVGQSYQGANGKKPPPPKPSNPPRLAHNDEFLERAEIAARRLIHSWIFHAPPRAVNQFDPERMPTGRLAEVAAGVLDATLNEGASDAAGIQAYFSAAPEGVTVELWSCLEEVAPLPESCPPIIHLLTRHWRQTRRVHLADKLARIIQAGDDPSPCLAEIAALEATPDRETDLLDRAYALAYDPAACPPKDEILMCLGTAPIAANGNITVLQGKSKVGKSAVVQAIVGAALRGKYVVREGDLLGLDWIGEHPTGRIIHFDTEQSPADWWGGVTRAVIRGGAKQEVPRLLSIPLTRFSRRERMSIITGTMARESAAGGVSLVVLDGVADVCKSPNDEEEALDLVSVLMALCAEHNTVMVCILHENPGTDQGKTRGHLGSELNRKAFANLRVDKDNETLVSTIYGLDMRKKDIPKECGFCFQWSEEHRMHVTAGTAREAKAAKSEKNMEENKEKFMTEVEKAFRDDSELSYSATLERFQQVFTIEKDAAKARLRKYSKLVLRKLPNGNYVIKND